MIKEHVLPNYALFVLLNGPMQTSIYTYHIPGIVYKYVNECDLNFYTFICASL